MIYTMAKLSEQVVFKAPGEWIEKLQRESVKERRALSAVERAIFERGYLAWLRDGLLFEPHDPGEMEAQATIQVKKPANKGAKKENPGEERTGTRG